MKLKICGLKYPENIEQITTMNTDYIGFIFHKSSPRYIEQHLSFDFVRSIPKHIQKVGVFVNESSYNIFNAVAHYSLDVVQLHGNESEQLCAELKPYVKIIKAFGIDERFDFTVLEKYIPYVDYFLFDTASKNYGGSGIAFNHQLLLNYQYSIPFFLSGGIDDSILESISSLNLKQLYALDINSKFEIIPGLKNIPKINSFINQLKQTQNAIISS